MSVAPEIARLAETALIIPAQSADPQSPQPHGPAPQTPGPGTPGPGTQAPGTPLTLGALSGQLRMIAATPERWWGLVRFDRDRSVKIRLEEHPSFEAWLVVLPPGDIGQDCDCDVVTIIAGEATEATEGTASNTVLRPGPLRVHGQKHQLRGQGTGYSISLHARAHRPSIHRPAMWK
jgi:hypothetical protein